jgi:hypothetical protein
LRISAASVLVFGALGLTACGDDEPDPVSQQAYDDEAERLCERHGGEVLVEADALAENPSSEAADASFLVADYVPRARAIVRSLDGFGFPVENAAEYTVAVDDALDALHDIEEDPIGLIARHREGLLLDEENPFLDVDAAFIALDIPC